MTPTSQDPPYLVPHSREPIVELYADEHLLLVRKPHLLLSIPGRHPRNRDCLIARLRQVERDLTTSRQGQVSL